MPPKLYLDACTLSRLTDDQAQTRIHEEAEAVERVLELIRKGTALWVASLVLQNEILRNPDRERRNDASSLLVYAGELFRPNEITIDRAKHLERLGYGSFDALHLACAEQSAADVLLTTDDRFIR